ncbi:unnamed protein product [Phytomonas sp. EM1]|nr:unnamed protein product [Phytomonas sp. EM1]|eukprot:CCW62011.1 unnamed protein product [Phytomonas sp. isolate EM1]
MKDVLKTGPKKDVDVFIPSSDLTLQQIRDKIPREYFQRDTVRSMSYLTFDLIQVAITCYVMSNIMLPCVSVLTSFINSSLPSPASLAISTLLKFFVWNVFWFVQGLNGTALWVLAHECGHRGFSPHSGLNNTVGLIIHSALLVPYHSWRISHALHHKHTNHLTKDTVFVPHKMDQITELTEECPLVMFCKMVNMFLFGWPTYLLFNVSGQDYGRRANHFEPSSPIFRPGDGRDIVISDLGVLSALSAIVVSCVKFGAFNVLCWYGIPYLWVNFWLVYITYMQHTDIRIPHYSYEEWTFVRGAIAAVDRDYGSVLNTWLHHINDSHVVHHLFSDVPFYNAIEISRKYIKSILGHTYVEDKQPLLQALCKTWGTCRYVVPSENICCFYGFNNKSKS